jgi:hypothetical protein
MKIVLRKDNRKWRTLCCWNFIEPIQSYGTAKEMWEQIIEWVKGDEVKD